MFSESYGTTGSAALLANVLQSEKSLDLNGVVLLSQILCFDNSADGPRFNPGVDQPYVLVLPSFTATAGGITTSCRTSRSLSIRC